MAKKEKLSLDEMLEKALVKDEDKPYEVPSNWVWTIFGSVCKLENGYAFSSDDYKETGVPLIRISNINGHTVEINGCVYIDRNDIDKKFLIYKGDLLIAMSGATTGKTGIYNYDFPAWQNQRVGNIKIIDTRILSPKYRNYFIISRQEEIFKKAYGGAQPNISGKMIEGLKIPLPPLIEQQRIADIIESTFEKLDRAEELVQNVLDSFEARKSAILRKAFNGELTAKWREENGVDFEREWEENLLGEICEINPKRISTKELDDDIEVTFVPMSSVSDIKGVIEQPLVKKLAEVKKGFTNFSVGDVIFAKITPCMENGKSAVVENLMNGIGFGSTEFHVLRCSERLYNRYLYHLVRWKKFRDEARQVMTGAVGQQRVPKEFLEQYTINTPPVKEQIEIVRILDNLLEKEQKARELCDIIIKNIEQLKKSILARAFRGELNTNNPGEESALELLKEVIQERMES